MNYLLEVENLAKQFGDLQAVDHISFGIRAGICFGLLGPNGAGKTTTIEMIEGITQSDSGNILFKGQALDKTFKQQAGIQFQQTSLMDYLTVSEVLDLFAGLYQRPMQRDQLVALCNLEELLPRPANKLSGGQRQRLLLGLALVNDPQIIFLDEPTTGLDPQARRNFWELVNTIRHAGTTIVLTTHYMDEAEYLCDELVIMDHGRIVDQGSPENLLSRHIPQKCIVISADNQAIASKLEHGDSCMRNGSIEILTDNVQATLQELIAKEAQLDGLNVRSPTLEDLFIKLTGHALRE